MAKRFLVLGASGFIGTYLTQYLSSQGHEVFGTYHSHARPDLKHCDLLNADEVMQTLASLQPEIVLFLSGSKDVKRCETDPAYGIDLNVQTARNFISACDKLGMRPLTIFFSTDYVFDGVRGSYGSIDPAGPRTVYGMTNLLAEHLFLASGLPGVLLRVSAVMGQRGGFFQWLKQSLERDEPVSLFDNTFFSPTSIGHLCRLIVQIACQTVPKTMIVSHLSDGYRMSRYQFGCLVAARLGKPESLVSPVSVDLNASNFQPDLSLLPDGQTQFLPIQGWNHWDEIW
jgi:dTDP-4-dehydrorhamnose reductase